MNPNQIPRERGAFEKDVKACVVSEASFKNEYFVFPAARAGATYSILVVL
jgi:hypothetical protein